MISVKDLTVSYSDKKVLENINIEYDSGSIVGIIGPNGAGKSTMIKAILNLIPKDSCEIVWTNDDLNKKTVAYIPQKSDVDWDFPLSVLDLVMMGLYPKIGTGRRVDKSYRELAKEVLKSVDMLEYKNRQIGQLSGGQQQRVFMARALIQEPSILFLDEPFVGIDTRTEKLLMNILKELRNKGKLIFIVHHDLSKVKEYFDDIILINKTIIAQGKVDQVYNNSNLKKAYLSQVSELGGQDELHI